MATAGETATTPPQAQNPLNANEQQQNHLTVPISQWYSYPPKLPCLQLMQGSREDYIKVGVPLYRASIKGDWKAAEAIFFKQPELIRYAITENFDTPLHIAAAAERTKPVEEFVRNLVNMMEKEDLELQNQGYYTAFHLAATVGNVETAKIMLERNRALTEIPGGQRVLPLYVAAFFARSEMVRYLYDNSRKMSGDFWMHENRGWVLQKCVEAHLFDVAVKILNDRPELTSNKRLLRDVLLLLAQNTDALNGKKPHIMWRIIKSSFAIFHIKVRYADRERDALQLLKMIWEKIVIMPTEDIDEIIQGPPVVTEELQQNTTSSGVVIGEQKVKKTTYPSRVLFVAAKSGNTRFIIELIQSYPDLIWKVDDKGQSIFHIAVKRRQANIYNLLYDIGSMKDLITPMKDKNGNNMLHLVAKSAKSERFQNVSGVALQMQRELLWYKEIEQMIPPTHRKRKNKDGETPHSIFRKNHKMLVTEGERWMKETAPQCMVVATLIATIVFAAAFTLPGGYDQNTGNPIFRQNAALIVFVIADAISLIFASATVLTFLSIFTSRYADIDFLESLPKMLMFGLATLFISIVTMMIAFSASFFVLYRNGSIWVPIMVTAFAAMPLVLFAYLQFRFLVDVFYSTYRSKSLFKPKKRMLY